MFLFNCEQLPILQPSSYSPSVQIDIKRKIKAFFFIVNVNLTLIFSVQMNEESKLIDFLAEVFNEEVYTNIYTVDIMGLLRVYDSLIYVAQQKMLY